MKPLAAKILLSAGTSLIVLGIAYFVHSRLVRDRGEVLELVDTRDRLEVLLDERATRPALGTERYLGDPALRREIMDLATAQLFFPPAGVNRPYFPDMLCANRPSFQRWLEFREHPRGGFTVKTNSLGMMNDAEVENPAPDYRCLIVGDSHGVGLCENSETFAHRTKAHLQRHFPLRRIETLNASCGGYTLYNYLGVLEHYLPLKPRAFVFAVYGGNDFSPMMVMQRYYFRRPAPNFTKLDLELLRDLRPRHIASQELEQVLYFRNNPEDEPLAIETADALTREIERLCSEASIDLVAIYIPPPFRSQPRLFRSHIDETLPRLGIEEHELELSDRIADGWIAAARERGVDVIDLRPTFAAADRFMFFNEYDCHTNLEAHALIAERIADRLTNR
jgi:hypothetical protein